MKFQSILHIEEDYLTAYRFDSSKPLQDMEVCRILCKSTTKSCELDPIPTSLLKDSGDLMVPVITAIINK